MQSKYRLGKLQKGLAGSRNSAITNDSLALKMHLNSTLSPSAFSRRNLEPLADLSQPLKPKRHQLSHPTQNPTPAPNPNPNLISISISNSNSKTESEFESELGLGVGLGGEGQHRRTKTRLTKYLMSNATSAPRLLAGTFVPTLSKAEARRRISNLATLGMSSLKEKSQANLQTTITDELTAKALNKFAVGTRTITLKTEVPDVRPFTPNPFFLLNLQAGKLITKH